MKSWCLAGVILGDDLGPTHDRPVRTVPPHRAVVLFVSGYRRHRSLGRLRSLDSPSWIQDDAHSEPRDLWEVPGLFSFRGEDEAGRAGREAPGPLRGGGPP